MTTELPVGAHGGDQRGAVPLLWVWVAVIFLFGCAVRIVPWTSNQGMGYDESWYRRYVVLLDENGVGAYPDICAAYLKDSEAQETIAKAPPVRALFVFCGWIWKRVEFGSAPRGDMNTAEGVARDPARISLHHVATLFGCLGLIPAWFLGRRLFGERDGLAVLALFACSPLLIHMSQHALVDGIHSTLALFALWTLVESLRPRAHFGWFAGYAGSFMLMVLTKENSFFTGVALGVVMLFSGRMGLGKSGVRQWGAAIVGGLAALAILSVLAGGASVVIEVYQHFVGKARTLGYAQETGGGPWSRYLVDLMVFVPATLCFAVGGIFQTLAKDRRGMVLLVFFAATYVIMSSVPNGMNLRYTTIWDFPLRALAVVQVGALAGRFARAGFAMTVMVALLCLLDLRQYQHFFVTYRLLELAPEYLLKATEILK